MFDDDDVVIALYNTKIKIKYNFQFWIIINHFLKKILHLGF